MGCESMKELVLVTGGARSGKSTFAEQYLHERFKQVLYIATAIPYDEEMKDRIKKHQQQRPDHWTTYEGHRQLGQVVSESQSEAILLDCITILVTNLLFDHLGEKAIEDVDEKGLEASIRNEIRALLDGVKEYKGTIVMVTNELGSGLVPEHKLGRVFRDIAGRVNQMIAKEADKVYLAVSGIPVQIKGGKDHG